MVRFNEIVQTRDPARDKVERLLNKYFVLDQHAKFNIVGELVNIYDGGIRVKRLLPNGKLAIQFGVLDDYFQCINMNLCSLEGVPKETGNFSVFGNNLTSLVGGPKRTGSYACAGNKLISLVGAANLVEGNFRCQGNMLQSLEGLPDEIQGVFDCSWHANLPLLRLVGNDFSKGVHFGPDNPGMQVENILNKYQGKDGLRSKIIACQKELIDAGFEGNASW